MNSPSKNAGGKPNLEQVEELLKIRLSQMHSYHDHKEKMGHAGLLVGLALVAAVFSLSTWPPNWVPDICIPKRLVALFVLFLIWVFIHIYIRWQLRNRRVAALYVTSLLEVLREWVYKAPSKAKLKPYKDEEDLASFKTEFPTNSRILEFIDKYVFPVGRIFVPTDEEMQGYPALLVGKMIERRARRGALRGERLVTAGHLLILLLIVCRAFL